MRRIVLAAWLLGLAACSSDDGDAPPDTQIVPPTLSLASEASVRRGGSQSVIAEVTVDPSDTARTFTLAATGAPAGVAASFAPATLASGTSTLTLTAELTAALATTPLVVTAIADDGTTLTRSLSLTVADVAPITVSGSVVDTNGTAMDGLVVRIWGNRATTPLETTTDAGGAFTVDGVAQPYDVTIASTLVTYLYLGVMGTRMDTATLLDLHAYDDSAPTTVRGTLTSDATPTRVVTAATSAYGHACIPTVLGSGDAPSYQLNMPATTVQDYDVTVRSLAYTQNESATAVVSYDGYFEGATPVVTPGITTLDGTLRALPNQHDVTVTALDASGNAANATAMYFAHGPFDTRPSVTPALATVVPGNTGTSTYRVTGDEGVPLTLLMALRGGSLFARLPTTETTLALTLPSPIIIVSPTSPPAAATDTTTFTMSTVENATYVHQFTNGVSADEATYSVMVFSTSPTIAIGALSAHGLKPPADSQLFFTVRAVIGHPDDAFYARSRTSLQGIATTRSVSALLTLGSIMSFRTAPE